MGGAARPQAEAVLWAVQERRVSVWASCALLSTCTLQELPGPHRQGPGWSLSPRTGKTKEGKVVTPPTPGGKLAGGGRPRDGQFSEAVLLWGRGGRLLGQDRPPVTSLCLVPPAWG